MRNFDYAKLSTMLWDTEILSYIAKFMSIKDVRLYICAKSLWN